MNPLQADIAPWAEAAWTLFRERLEADRLAHALLLQGPEGVGKGALAQRIVETLLCLQPGCKGACGSCRSCQLLGGGAHPDRFEVTVLPGRKTPVISVAQVRELIASLGMTTTFSRRKVALVNPADAMNRNAANALLKTLEEPPGETVIILLAHEPARLPVTVRSRCQTLTVAMPERAAAAQWLQEQHGFSEADALDALRAAAGSPFRAVQYQREDRVGIHRALGAALQELYGGADRITDVMALVREIDDAALWLWLSGFCGERIREGQASLAALRPLLSLQQQADRFRGLSQTSVRGDLLLHEWLIEWCRAGAATRS